MDDFSDNYLDGEKWITSNQFFQGNVPVETNQEIRLEGHTPNNPSDASFLILNNLNNVFGVEADIWLPENAPVETAVLIGIAAGGTPLGSLDLWNDSDNPRMYIDLNNFETNEAISYSRNVALGNKYRVGIIEDNGKPNFS